VLLIVAVAAYALLVNNGSESEPEMTLADFEINAGDTLAPESAVAPANNSLLAPPANQSSGNQNSGNQTGGSQTPAERSGSIALAPPANDPQVGDWAGNSEVSEVKPDFDLAELMGSPAADMPAANEERVVPPAGEIATDNAPSPRINVPAPQFNDQPDWQRDLAAAGEAAGIREPAAGVTDFSDGVIREGVAASNEVPANEQPGSSPIRDNQWVQLDGREQAASSEQQLAEARRQREAYRPNSEPSALSAEDAIQAAVDAAVGDQYFSPAGPSATPSYRLSNQPAGIPDWSRYLPPPQNSSNRGSLIQGPQPGDANPGQYPGQYPGSAVGNPGAPQQAYGMPTGYQQPPTTR